MVISSDLNEMSIHVRKIVFLSFFLKILSEVLKKGTESYPCGQDVSGVVVKVGEGVTNVELDDDVVGRVLDMIGVMNDKKLKFFLLLWGQDEDFKEMDTFGKFLQSVLQGRY